MLPEAEKMIKKTNPFSLSQDIEGCMNSSYVIHHFLMVLKERTIWSTKKRREAQNNCCNSR